MSRKDLRSKAGAALEFAVDHKPESTRTVRTVTGPGGIAFAGLAIEEHQKKADAAIADANRHAQEAEARAAAAAGELEGAREALATAKGELSLWDGASPVRKLDPALIHRSRWANRSEAEFATKEFAELKDEIAQAGGNVQPILVRKVSLDKDHTESSGVRDTTPVERYEIVYGHRRHQACLELGLPVSAQVMDLNDQALFSAMDRENRSRKSLSPFEQGRMYAEALDAGLYPSLRRLAESVGVDHGNAGRHIELARLPVYVRDAFSSPLDLQRRWAAPLTEAVEKDPDAVRARAALAVKVKATSDAASIFAMLIGATAAPQPKIMPIEIKGKKMAVVRIAADGKTVVEFRVGALSSTKATGLTKLIRDYLSH